MNKTLLGMVLLNAEAVFSLLINHSKHEYHNSHRLCFWRAVFRADTNLPSMQNSQEEELSCLR